MNPDRVILTESGGSVVATMAAATWDRVRPEPPRPISATGLDTGAPVVCWRVSARDADEIARAAADLGLAVERRGPAGAA